MSSFFHVLGCASVLLVVGCGASRQSQCEAIRDRQVSIQKTMVAEALESVSDEFRDELRKRGEAEIAMFQAKFVGECTKHAELDLACFENTQRAQQHDCKKTLDSIESIIYADLSE